MKGELSRVAQEKEDMAEKNKQLKDLLNSKKLEIQRMTGQGASDFISRRE